MQHPYRPKYAIKLLVCAMSILPLFLQTTALADSSDNTEQPRLYLHKQHATSAGEEHKQKEVSEEIYILEYCEKLCESHEFFVSAKSHTNPAIPQNIAVPIAHSVLLSQVSGVLVVRDIPWLSNVFKKPIISKPVLRLGLVMAGIGTVIGYINQKHVTEVFASVDYEDFTDNYILMDEETSIHNGLKGRPDPIGPLLAYIVNSNNHEEAFKEQLMEADIIHQFVKINQDIDLYAQGLLTLSEDPYNNTQRIAPKGMPYFGHARFHKNYKRVYKSLHTMLLDFLVLVDKNIITNFEGPLYTRPLYEEVISKIPQLLKDTCAPLNIDWNHCLYLYRFLTTKKYPPHHHNEHHDPGVLQPLNRSNLVYVNENFLNHIQEGFQNLGKAYKDKVQTIKALINNKYQSLLLEDNMLTNVESSYLSEKSTDTIMGKFAIKHAQTLKKGNKRSNHPNNAYTDPSVLKTIASPEFHKRHLGIPQEATRLEEWLYLQKSSEAEE